MATLYQKRHYEDVARTLREAKASLLVSVRIDTLHVWQETVRMFVDRFRRDNPRFDAYRFLKSAGYQE